MKQTAVEHLKNATNQTIYAQEQANYNLAIDALESTVDVFQDMNAMHQKYGVHEWVKNNPEKLKQFLQFRINFLDEELNETKAAFAANDPEEIVDGLIDLIVIAAGTLDLYGIDSKAAWEQVYNANMSKEVGVKPTRPNPLGVPDLIKPEGWQGPSHENNHGLFKNL